MVNNNISVVFQSLSKNAQAPYDACRAPRCSSLAFRTIKTFYSGWAILEGGKWSPRKPRVKWICIHNGINPELTIRQDKQSIVVEKVIKLNPTTSFRYENGNTISLKPEFSSRIRLRYATDIAAQNWLDLIHQAISHGVFMKNLKVKSQIGEGSFSKVLSCENVISGEEYALKVIDGATDGNAEIAILLKLRQMCKVEPIVDIVKVFENQESTVIMMPRYTGDTLYTVVKAKGFLPEFCASSHIRELSAALQVIHSQGVVHCDLKLENIMFTKTGRVRLIDFGGAIDLAFVDKENQSGSVGTPGYISPERLDGKPALPPADIFSLGIILYQMLTGRNPFHATSKVPIHVTRNLKFSAKQWLNLSEEARDLVRRMVDPNPLTRITAAQILQHPWIIDLPVME